MLDIKLIAQLNVEQGGLNLSRTSTRTVKIMKQITEEIKSGTLTPIQIHTRIIELSSLSMRLISQVYDEECLMIQTHQSNTNAICIDSNRHNKFNPVNARWKVCQQST